MSVLLAAARLPSDPTPLDRDGWSPASAARSAAIARKRHAIDRVRSRLADYLLVLVAGVTVDYDAVGRPKHPMGAGVSASHDGAWVVAATAEGSIGVDVVDLTRASAIPRSVFDSDEQARLDDSNASGVLITQARIWAAKEAHLKRLGVGLARHPSTISSRPLSGHLRILDGENPSLVLIEALDPHHVLAVAVADEGAGTHLVQRDPSPGSIAPPDPRRPLIDRRQVLERTQ